MLLKGGMKANLQVTMDLSWFIASVSVSCKETRLADTNLSGMLVGLSDMNVWNHMEQSYGTFHF